jgi:hypothetical protein
MSTATKPRFALYQEVICNGYIGKVTEVKSGQLDGMYDVRVPGGLTCVGGSELRDIPSIIIIDNRSYTVELMETGDRTRRDLIDRGWDGQTYLLKGNRSAVHMAYRNWARDEFIIIR